MTSRFFSICLTVSVSGCAIQRHQSDSSNLTDNKIVSQLASLRTGHSLFGVFKNLGIREEELNEKIVNIPLKPVVYLTISKKRKWIEFEIELDRQLYNGEFSNVALGMEPRKYTKNGLCHVPKIKSIKIVFYDPDYKGFSGIQDYSIRKLNINEHDEVSSAAGIRRPVVARWEFQSTM